MGRPWLTLRQLYCLSVTLLVPTCVFAMFLAERHSFTTVPTSQLPNQLTIVSAVQFANGSKYIAYRNAVSSWLTLVPPSNIILYVDDVMACNSWKDLGVRCIAAPSRCISADYNKMFVRCLFLEPEKLTSALYLAVVNTDILLDQDFLTALRTVRSRVHRFLMVGQRTDINFQQLIDFEAPAWRESLLKTASSRKLHGVYGLDYWVWSRGIFENLQIPDFLVGVWRWDNWLLSQVLMSDIPVVDATHAVLALHLDDPKRVPHRSREGSTYNDALAAASGGNLFQLGVTSSADWQLRGLALKPHLPDISSIIAASNSSRLFTNSNLLIAAIAGDRTFRLNFDLVPGSKPLRVALILQYPGTCRSLSVTLRRKGGTSAMLQSNSVVLSVEQKQYQILNILDEELLVGSYEVLVGSTCQFVDNDFLFISGPWKTTPQIQRGDSFRADPFLTKLFQETLQPLGDIVPRFISHFGSIDDTSVTFATQLTLERLGVLGRIIAAWQGTGNIFYS